MKATIAKPAPNTTVENDPNYVPNTCPNIS